MQRNIHELVAELPQSPDAVALKLHVEHIKGIRKSCLDCPLVRYFKGYTSSDYVRIRGNQLTIRLSSKEMETYLLPDHLVEFYRAFDDGQYSFLETRYSNVD